jgi:predicted amidohydrolase
MDVLTGQVEANLNLAGLQIHEAAEQGGQLALLPELWSSGYDLNHAHLLAQQLNYGPFNFMSEQALKYQIFIGGSALESYQDKIFNTFALYNPLGELSAYYRKVHLFRLMDEDQWLTPGNRIELAEFSFGQVGLSICYDLRFPEQFRRLAIAGARLILLPSEWPAARIEHFRILVRARAIENQFAFAATNCTGVRNGESFGGCSLLVDAWGETAAEAGSQPGVVTGEIDLELTDRIRKKMDVLGDRRPELYQ